MKVDEIKLMFEYNFWADKRILAACAGVSDEQFRADTPFGNLFATVLHTLDGVSMWRQGFAKYTVPADQGGGDAPLWDTVEITEADVPTLDALRARWAVEEQALRAYLDGLHDDDLHHVMHYGVPGGIVRERVLWTCLVHLVNHGTQHRSEAAALLTSYGQSPGGMDMTQFMNEFYNLPG